MGLFGRVEEEGENMRCNISVILKLCASKVFSAVHFNIMPNIANISSLWKFHYVSSLYNLLTMWPWLFTFLPSSISLADYISSLEISCCFFSITLHFRLSHIFQIFIIQWVPPNDLCFLASKLGIAYQNNCNKMFFSKKHAARKKVTKENMEI